MTGRSRPEELGLTARTARSFDAGAAAYDRFTGRWSRLYVSSLLSAAGIDRGHSVLDVAAGTGQATVALASRVGPAGRVVAVDLSPGMLRGAAGKTAGLPARFAVMDGQRLACRSRSFDAVVCQLGLMFFPDPLQGLEEFRRVLRSGGRTAVQVWSRPERVPYFGILADALSAEVPEQRAMLYQPAALADTARLSTLLSQAGFREVSVIPERRSLEFASFEAYWEGIEAGASRPGQLYLTLAEDRRRKVRAAVERAMAPFRAGDRLALEVEAFIGQGVNPS